MSKPTTEEQPATTRKTKGIGDTYCLPIATYAVRRIKFNDSGFGASLKKARGRLHFNDLIVLVVQKLRAKYFLWKIDQHEQDHAERKAHKKRAFPQKGLQYPSLHHYRASVLSTQQEQYLAFSTELQQHKKLSFGISVHHDVPFVAFSVLASGRIILIAPILISHKRSKGDTCYLLFLL